VPPRGLSGAAVALVGIFEINAANHAAGGRMKKETRLRGDFDCRPSLALRHPCCPIYPRPHHLPAVEVGFITVESHVSMPDDARL
jgi:hypothetical protein